MGDHEVACLLVEGVMDNNNYMLRDIDHVLMYPQLLSCSCIGVCPLLGVLFKLPPTQSNSAVNIVIVTE